MKILELVLSSQLIVSKKSSNHLNYYEGFIRIFKEKKLKKN